MYCKNCGKEISDESKFCSYCGEFVEQKVETSEQNDESEPQEQINNEVIDSPKETIKRTDRTNPFLPLIIFLVILVGSLCFIYTQTPECTIYNSVVAMKNNDYNKTVEYINVEKIVNNRIDALTEEMMDDQELKGNPFAGLAYMFVEAIKPRLTEMIQDAIKEVVESPDNVFQNVQNIHLFLFTLIKNYDGTTLYKIVNEPKKVVFEFNNSDVKNLRLVLVKNSANNWEIVDIQGYEFWKDENINFLEHLNK